MPRFPIFNVRSDIINEDRTANKTFYSFCLSIWNALNNNSSAKISTPEGGDVIDVEARTAIGQIITALEKYGVTKE